MYPQILFIEILFCILVFSLICKVGALSTPTSGIRNPHDGQLTFVGRVLADLPVDIRIGKLIMLGHVFGLLEECLIIGKYSL